MTKPHSTFFAVVLLLIIITTSCNEDNLEPGVPAFIKVDTIMLSTDYSQQGTNSSKIVDVWVFADDETIGGFEIPARIPILKKGMGKLRLEAGIKLNGITTTRLINPFFKPYIIEDFEFVPDSVITINPVVEYWETTEFVWMEDFEDPAVSLDTTNLRSDVNVERTAPGLAFQGQYSGIVQLDTVNSIFEAANFEAVSLPLNGSPVMLEMNYRNDMPFVVGIFAQTSTDIIKKEVIYINPRQDWNKIYINLTDFVIESSAGTQFKVFFRSAVGEGTDYTSGEMFLDNLKLIYR